MIDKLVCNSDGCFLNREYLTSIKKTFSEGCIGCKHCVNKEDAVSSLVRKVVAPRYYAKGKALTNSVHNDVFEELMEICNKRGFPSARAYAATI